MMTLKVQLVIGFFLLVAFVAITNMIRKKYLELRYALMWLGIVAALLIFTIFPQLMDSMAKVLGISSPVNMIFFLGFCFALGVIFILTVAIARMSDRVRRLAQAVAILSDQEQLQQVIKESMKENSADEKCSIDRDTEEKKFTF